MAQCFALSIGNYLSSNFRDKIYVSMKQNIKNLSLKIIEVLQALFFDYWSLTLLKLDSSNVQVFIHSHPLLCFSILLPNLNREKLS